MDNKYFLTVPEDLAPQRLDKYISNELPDISRVMIQALIGEGLVTINDVPAKSPSQKIRPTDAITLIYEEPKIEMDLTPNPDVQFDIVYEDDHLAVINKPAGVVVHPGAGRETDTLVHGLLARFQNKLSDVNDTIRPGIVHRLDKQTSGLMVIAKTNQAHYLLADQLQDHSMHRLYMSVVWGHLSTKRGWINTQIGRHSKDRKRMAVIEDGGKNAITQYRRVKYLGTHACLVACRLKTGRTHQIRVHLTDMGYPIIGDDVYTLRRNKKQREILSDDQKTAIDSFDRLALHAARLCFVHPMTKQPMAFKAELPEKMQEIIKILS